VRRERPCARGVVHVSLLVFVPPIPPLQEMRSALLRRPTAQAHVRAVQSISLLLGPAPTLARNRSSGASLRTRVGPGALATQRQIAAVAQTPVGPYLLQSFDVLGDLSTQVTLDLMVSINNDADTRCVLLRQILDPDVGVDPSLIQDSLAGGLAYAVDVGERDLRSLVVGQVNAGDPSHDRPPVLYGQARTTCPTRLALPLLVSRIPAQNPDHTSAPHDPAVLAQTFD